MESRIDAPTARVQDFLYYFRRRTQHFFSDAQLKHYLGMPRCVAASYVYHAGFADPSRAAWQIRDELTQVLGADTMPSPIPPDDTAVPDNVPDADMQALPDTGVPATPSAGIELLMHAARLFLLPENAASKPRHDAALVEDILESFKQQVDSAGKVRVHAPAWWHALPGAPLHRWAIYAIELHRASVYTDFVRFWMDVHQARRQALLQDPEFVAFIESWDASAQAPTADPAQRGVLEAADTALIDRVGIAEASIRHRLYRDLAASVRTRADLVQLLDDEVGELRRLTSGEEQWITFFATLVLDTWEHILAREPDAALLPSYITFSPWPESSSFFLKSQGLDGHDVPSDCLARWQQWQDAWPSLLQRNPALEMRYLISWLSEVDAGQSWPNDDWAMEDWITRDVFSRADPTLYARLKALRAQVGGWVYMDETDGKIRYASLPEFRQMECQRDLAREAARHDQERGMLAFYLQRQKGLERAIAAGEPYHVLVVARAGSEGRIKVPTLQDQLERVKKEIQRLGSR